MRRWTVVIGSLCTLGAVAMAGGCGQAGQPTSSSGHAALTDTDGDGIADIHDICPEGPYDPTKTNAVGCPDEDLDGVKDGEDRCENTPVDTPVRDDGCPINDPRDGFGAETYVPRVVPATVTEALAFAYLDTGWQQSCEDDHVPPPMPAPVTPAIWSVEFSRAWHAGEPVEIEFSQVQDPCSPVTYGIEVQRRDNGAWLTAVSEKKLSQPSYTVPWEHYVWGRYRAFARDNNGHRSPWTPWRYFTFPGPDVPPADRFVAPPMRDPW